MLSKNELRYALTLQRVPNLGDTSAKKLLHHVGSAEGIFKEKRQNLLKIEGIGALKLKGLMAARPMDAVDEELKFIENNDITCCFYTEDNYPDRLKHCPDGPILFFQKGEVDLSKKKILSVVGTRNITNYGKDFCERLIEELAPIDPIIVSGFAYGVDITAHKAAVKHGLQTIGCLAHGMNQIYPKAHRKYVKRIEEKGGFITEFWSTDVFDRTNFLKRNRIIAGLSEATVVIESASKGGSLVTADIANSYHRDVFALPGRTTDIQSRGCNNLIRSQQAHMLTGAADIIYMLNWMNESPKATTQKQLFVTLTPEEQVLFDFLKQRDKEQLDIIALACKMPTFKVVTILLNMELKGVIRPLPGKQFQVT